MRLGRCVPRTTVLEACPGDLPGHPRRAKAMLRKLIVTGLVVVGAGTVLAKTNLGSYVSTACRRTSDTVKDSVPMEFQIDRARDMVRELEPEIRRSMHVIAKEEVEVAALDERIAGAEERSGKDKEDILRL